MIRSKRISLDPVYLRTTHFDTLLYNPESWLEVHEGWKNCEATFFAHWNVSQNSLGQEGPLVTPMNSWVKRLCPSFGFFGNFFGPFFHLSSIELNPFFNDLLVIFGPWEKQSGCKKITVKKQLCILSQILGIACSVMFYTFMQFFLKQYVIFLTRVMSNNFIVLENFLHFILLRIKCKDCLQSSFDGFLTLEFFWC